jgi:hypothetical protein
VRSLHRAALVQSFRGVSRFDRRRGTVIFLSLLVLAVTLVGMAMYLPTAPVPAAVVSPADPTTSEESLTSTTTLPLPSSEPPDAESAANASAESRAEHQHDNHS